MAYYDTIKYASNLSQAAEAERAANFDALYTAEGLESAVSRWGRKHLLASRVVCSEPKRRLALFQGFYPDNLDELHPCIRRLISGPGKVNLANMWEPQFVQQYQPDSLGYTWAALASFARAERGEPAGAASERPSRAIKPTSRYENYVTSTNIQIGSSSPTQPSSGDESDASAGYTSKIKPPLVEDLIIRLASCFFRCVLNWAQRPTGPLLHYRDQRQTYTFQAEKQASVGAIDDGGVQLYDGTRMRQVATLEGKRTFTDVDDCEPKIPDQVLAQIVGEALALRRDRKAMGTSLERHAPSTRANLWPSRCSKYMC